MSRQILILLLAITAVLAPVRAQTPTTIVVPAATPASPSQVRAAVAVDAPDPAKILQQLREMKAANDETIRRQEAVLQQLDELQKTAEQLRLFVSRS